MFKCECVCRRYKYKPNGFIVSKEYKKLMKHVGTVLKSGKQVTMKHQIIANGDWYDKVTVTIK